MRFPSTTSFNPRLRKREELVGMKKSYEIPKRLIWEACQRVKSNGGAAGVDNESIEKFENRLRGNLCKVWNRIGRGVLPWMRWPWGGEEAGCCLGKKRYPTLAALRDPLMKFWRQFSITALAPTMAPACLRTQDTAQGGVVSPLLSNLLLSYLLDTTRTAKRRVLPVR